MSPSSAGRQRRSLPRSGSPLWGAFLFGNVPECSDASDGTWGGRARKNADRRSFRSEPLERAFAAVPGTTAAGLRRSPGKRQACVAAGDASRCPAFCHPGGGRSGASPVGAVCHGNGTGTAGAIPSGPAIRPQQDGCGGKAAPPAGKEAPCCRRGLPFAGFWSMEARSSKHTPAAARGARQCATAHFSLSSGHGAGAAAGRVAGSGPVWKITTLLED